MAATSSPEPLVVAQVYNAPVLNKPAARDEVEPTTETTGAEISIKVVKINSSPNLGFLET